MSQRTVLFSSRLGRAVIVAALVFSSSVAQAADEEFVGSLALALDASAAAQLELSTNVRAQLVELINRREQEAVDIALAVKSLSPAEQRAKLAPFIAESERLGLAMLSEKQRTRLQQLHIAKTGLSSLADANVATKTNLTKEQQSQIAELIAQRDLDVQDGSDEQKRIAHAVYERRLAKLLTAEQKLLWDQLAGLAEKSEAAVPFVAANAPPKPIAGEPLAENRLPAANPQPERPASAPLVVAAPGKSADGKLRFNFRYAPWKEVLDWFAQQGDLSLVLDAPPSGTFNYTDARSYTPGEAIDLLNSVLLTKGYTLVRRDRMLMLVNLQDGVPANLVTNVAVADLDRRGESELISCLFPLETLAPQDVEAELKKLLGPQGSLVVLAKSRQVLVTDTAGRLRTVRNVIEAAEKSPHVRDEPLRTFELKHATAESVLQVARQLLAIPEDRLATPDGSLRLAIGPQGLRFLVTGKPDMVARFEEVLQLVDVAGGPAQLAERIETPQLEVYAIATADPAAVLQVMQTLLAGMPDVRLASDPKTGNLIALARPSQHATIRATLDQLQRDGRQFEVIHLRKVDPQVAAVTINKLFGADEEGKGGNGPKLEAEPEARQLLVRGSASQIREIRSLLAKMGEENSPADPTGADRQNLRFIPLSNAAAQAALEQAKALWEASHANQVRVITHTGLQNGSKARERFPGKSESESPPASGGSRPETQPGERPIAAPQSTRPSTEKRFEIPAPREKSPPNPESPPQAQDPFSDDKHTNNAQGRLKSLPTANHSPPRVRTNRIPVLLVSESSSPESPGATNTTPQAEAANPPKIISVRGAEIVVAPAPGGIVISSKDIDALDQFESLLRSLVETPNAAPQYTVFYLKYAKSDVAAALVQEIMSGGSAGQSSGGEGSLVNSLASAALGDSGGGLIGSLLGLGGASGAGSGMASTGKVTMVADSRLNALVVQANAKDLAAIELLLKIIDQEASPEDVQTVAKPRLIPVLHSSAEEVAVVVRQVYAERVSGATGQQRQPSPEEFIRALRGGGGRSRQERSKSEELQSLSIGVDKRLNALIVSAAEPLFLEVKALVEQLDQSSGGTEETMRVVSLKGANPELVQKALVSIGGDKVRSSISKVSGSAVPTNPANTTPRTTNATSNPATPIGDAARDDMRQRMDFFNALQRAGSGGRGEGARGGSGRGTFGGDRSGGGR